MKIEKLTHTYRNPGYKDGVLNTEWKEVTFTFPYSVIIDKINEIVDFLNNSQQEEKKGICTACEWKYVSGCEAETVEHTCKAENNEECEISKHKGYCIDCEENKDQSSKEECKHKNTGTCLACYNEAIKQPSKEENLKCDCFPSQGCPHDQPSKEEKKPCEKGAIYDPQCKRCVELNEDQPSKPSIRESVGQILIDYAVFGKGRIEAENQILDLITNAIMEEAEKQTQKMWVYESDYSAIDIDDLEYIVNNIKK